MLEELTMKFNEAQIKNIIQQETSVWNSDDLSWFDENYLARFESKKLPPVEHQKIISMLAHDQTVMNHYQALKRKLEKSSPLTTGFSKWFLIKKPVILMLSLASLAVSFGLIYTNFESIEKTDVFRSPTEFLIYPEDNMALQNAPTYLVAPPLETMETGFKIEIYRDSLLLWKTTELNTPRVYLPPEIRQQLKVGHYNWQILTVNNQIIDQFSFSIEY